MVLRTLFFVAVLGGGGVALVASLLPSQRLKTPESFQPEWREGAEVALVIHSMDQMFEEQAEAAGLRVAPRAGDLEIARRISLALTGTIPSLEEVRKIQSLPQDIRIDWFLARILDDRRSSDYLAERFARAFVGTEDGPFIVFRRRRFVTWLSDQLEANRPYDEIARALISDTGAWTGTPSVNFVSVTVDQNMGDQPDPIRLAARTSRAFLGMRIDCLQCHDDNLGTIDLGDSDDVRGGLQTDFHQLAAFYREANSSPLGIRDGNEKEYEYRLLDSDVDEVISNGVPYRSDLVPEKGTRRQKLAAWVTHRENLPFSRAVVNRAWAIMFSRPLVAPIDDIPLHETLPPVMELLANDFAEHNFDLKRLLKLIAYTEVFQRSSRADFSLTQAHEENWAVFPLTRLRPEQVAGALIQSSVIKTIDADSHIFSQILRFGEENDFVKRYGDKGEDEFLLRESTIPQRLIMMNGKLVSERTEASGVLLNSAAQIASFAPNDRSAVESLYLTVFSRKPDPIELKHFVAKLAGKNNRERTIAIQDLHWVLVNSPEFAWNH